jgi:uncharacterized protein YutE (UPF0331/DUF86 family)
MAIAEPSTLKIASLQRCVARARALREAAGNQFRLDFDRQDAAVLNVIRACESAIDLANILIRNGRFGIPTESRESFDILSREKLLAPELAKRLKAMVAFRNLAVHQYRELDLAILENVIDKNLDDLLAFAETVRLEMSKRAG